MREGSFGGSFRKKPPIIIKAANVTKSPEKKIQNFVISSKDHHPLLDSAKKQTEAEPKKVLSYKNTKVKIGTGKLGPIDLIIYED